MFVYTECQRQLCKDASDAVLTETNGDALKWVATLFWSNSTGFNESSIAALALTLYVKLP